MVFHPAFDGKFRLSFRSTFRDLARPELSHKVGFVMQSEKALLSDPIDGRQAIGSVFDAAENLLKCITGKQNITNKFIRNDLQPIVLNSVPQDGKSNAAVTKMLGAFEDWTATHHIYKHSPGETEAAQPSTETAILIVSQGYAHARWLTEHDQGSSDQ